MPGPAAARVDELRVAPMGRSHGARETALILRHENQVNVVGHEAIRPDLDGSFRRLIGEEIAIDLLIALLEKNGLAPVAPLRDVMRKAGNHNSGTPRHLEASALTASNSARSSRFYAEDV